MIDTKELKPLLAEVERTRRQWERSLTDPAAPLGGSADFHAALYELAGTVAGLVDAAEREALPVRLH